MGMKFNETNSVVKPVLQWLALSGFAVLGGDTAIADLQSISGATRGIVWRNNSGVAMLPGRGGKRRPVRFGVPGQADISGILQGGRRLEIECKMPNRKLTDEQKSFGKAITMMGGLYIVTYGIDDLVTYGIDDL